MMKLRSIFIYLLILSSIVFMTGAAYIDGNYRVIAEGSELEMLLFEADGADSDIVITADGRTSYYRTDGEGNILHTLELPENTFSAYIYGESIYCFCSVNSRVRMNEISITSGEALNSFYVKTDPLDLEFICGDAFGNVYYVKKSLSVTIYKCDADGYSAPIVEGEEEIAFCGVTDDLLIYYSGGAISQIPVYADADPVTFPSSYIPAKFFSTNCMVDTKGVYCVLSGTAEPVYDSGILWNDGRLTSHLADENSCFYTVIDDYSVKKSDDSGSALYQASGIVCGINANGIMVLDESELKFAPYSSYLFVEDSPSPEPSASPVPTTEPPDKDAEITGEYMIVQEGRTVSSLKKAFNAEIYLNGSPAAAGVCRTGMVISTAGESYTIIILGDVNGSGTVNSADIDLIQCHIIGKSALEGSFLYAADYSANGFIETGDLVLIAKSLN